MECPHGYPSPAACMDCFEERGLGAPRREPESMVAMITARRDGQCPEWDLPIIIGQRIVKTNRERWIHDTCCPGVVQ